jgi:hypothetical protein
MLRPRHVCALLALGLPMMTGACAVPLAVTAASYGVDGALAVETGKTSTDHFLSMTSKKDCSVWRVFRHQDVCKDRPQGAKDPYQVNYDEPFYMGPDGYGPPLHAAPGAPSHSWDAAAYKPEPQKSPTAPITATAEAPPAVEASSLPPPEAAPPPPAVSPVHHKKKTYNRSKMAKARKPSPNQVASAH